jgi:GPH family glycoside/pentoside/hexuronide:cation symporter
MFAAPLLFPNAVVIAAAATHVVFRTCYTVVSIPYSALMAKITRDSGERGSLAGIRMIFATIGGLFTVFATLPLATSLVGDLRLGFVLVAAIYGALATAIILLTFATTREVAELTPHRRLTGKETVEALLSNTALLQLIAAISLGATGGAVFSKSLIYYVKYVAGIDLSITAALVALTAATSVSIPLWMFASKYLNKRDVWLAGAGIAASMQLALYLAPPQSPTGFLALLLTLGLGNGAFYVTFWSMLPDTVEYGEWRSGIRDEGLAFGLNQLALKAAAGLGIGVLGFALEAVGYVAGETQSAGTTEGLRALTTLLPLVSTLGAAAIIAFYPINHDLHERLVRAIDRRSQRNLP